MSGDLPEFVTMATIGGPEPVDPHARSGDSATEARLMEAGYSALSLLGRGGMGEVWRGCDAQGEMVALKLIHPHLASDAQATERFAREARVGLALHDPHVVHTRAVSSIERRGIPVPMIVMDYIQGHALSDRAEPAWPAARIHQLALDVARGLCAIHAGGFVHRDIKPANLLVGDDGSTRILDLGIARPVDDTGVTRTGQMVGTLTYAAPEQLAGRSTELDARADLYALGVVLRELITGTSTFGDAPIPEVLARKWDPLPPIAADTAPAWFISLLDALTQPQPDARPPSAVEVLACLEDRRSPRKRQTGEHPSRQGQPVVRTLLLTDLVDSTALLHRLGDDAASELMTQHDRVARDLLSVHDGREIDKSDGFLHIFRSPASAIRYAIAYHEELRALSAAMGVRLLSRVGIHTGSVRLVASRHTDVALGAKVLEIEGVAKPIAARVMTVARGGQTLATDAVLAAMDTPIDDVAFARHGFYKLKGIDAPMQLTGVAPTHLGPQPPPTDSPKVFRVLQTPAGWTAARDVPNNLPKLRDTFVGRHGELRSIANAFDTEARLVTLLGGPGTGKSRLAVQFGTLWLGNWPGGVWMCRLAEASGVDELLHALGRDLDVPLEGDPLTTLGEAINNRGRCLVVLDTFEHLMDATAVLEGLRRHAPAARWLLTSRQRVGLAGEDIVRVEPLAGPSLDQPLADMADNPAVALFVHRAQAAQPRFALTTDNAQDIARLVQLLDGLPLAIELAAARARVLSPKKLLQRLGRRLDLLKGQGSGRGATLRGALDASWELLTPTEQAGLATCAVFEGTFDLEAAEAVIDLSDLDDTAWAMDILESLVEKSLVRATPDGLGDSRFTLLGAVRDYAQEHLAKLGRRDLADTAHAEHYATWGDPDRLSRLHGEDALAARQELRADLGNVTAAVEFAAGAGLQDAAARSAVAALTLLGTVGPLPMAERLGSLALVDPPEGPNAVRLRIALGVARNRAGELERASTVLEEALEQSRSLGEEELAAAALHELGHGALLQRRVEDARQHLLEAITRAKRTRAHRIHAAGLAELAHLDGIRGGAYDEPLTQLEQARSLQQRCGDVSGEALTESYLGALHCTHGHFERGGVAYERSRELARTLGDRRTAGLAEGMLAGICVLTDRLDEARGHFKVALQTQREIGDRVYEALHATNFGHFLERLDEFEESIRWLERAILIARDMGDGATEGISLGTLGTVRARSGRARRALLDLDRGETLLRAAGDPVELGKLLCRKGKVLWSLDETEPAGACLTEAQEIVADLGLTHDAELAVAARDLDRELAKPESHKAAVPP